MDSSPAESVEGVLDTKHGNGVDGRAFKDTLNEFAAFGEAEDFGQGPQGCRTQVAQRHGD